MKRYNNTQHRPLQVDVSPTYQNAATVFSRALVEAGNQPRTQWHNDMLPVPWELGTKMVLSGLSANSCGSGCRRNTVNHIRLLARLDAGRIHRTSGDFLCTPKSGSNGSEYASGEMR